jgi:hypothetical protein
MVVGTFEMRDLVRGGVRAVDSLVARLTVRPAVKSNAPQ